jgi:rhodanese-related sulfurtransferase
MKMTKVLFTAGLFLIVAAGTACRDANKTAEEEFGVVSTEELSNGIKNRTLMVFDNNTPELYQKKHIPSAVFMDHNDPDPNLLPADKDAKLVFYCKNTRCIASHEGARFAKSQGYTQVRVYPLGIDGWEKAGMPLESGEVSMD